MKGKPFYFIAFDSTHYAILFEEALIASFDVELIPTPRDVSASCGLALRFKEEDVAAIRQALKTLDYDKTRLYHYALDEEGHIKEINWGDFYAVKA